MGKKSGRSIRSSIEEKVQTPSQKHYHYLGRKNNPPIAENYQKNVEKKRKQRLLEMLKEREKSGSRGVASKREK